MFRFFILVSLVLLFIGCGSGGGATTPVEDNIQENSSNTTPKDEKNEIDETLLIVQNHAPNAVPQTISLEEDSSVNITLTGSDADDDNLTY